MGTPVNKTAGTRIASDSLKGRVYEVSLADLQNDEVAFRKFRLICEDVQGRNCLTNFHGMNLTTDKTRSMVKKWQSMIEARVDVKTSDGYTLRLFCVGFTKKRQNQIKKTSYAQTQQVKNIRRKMVDIINKEVSSADLKENVNKLIPDSIGKDIEKACQSIYPLYDVFINKVKVLKRPRFDLGKLLEMHGEGKGAVAMETAEGEVVSHLRVTNPPSSTPSKKTSLNMGLVIDFVNFVVMGCAVGIPSSACSSTEPFTVKLELNQYRILKSLLEFSNSFPSNPFFFI